jgi:hypothetical protein
MVLVTCYTKDCKTPNFYVDPKGGKIVLIEGAGSPKLNLDVSTIQKFQKFQGGDRGFTEEELGLFETLERLQTVDAPKTYGGLPVTVEIENATDYLVVHCESNHKNYILIKK